MDFYLLKNGERAGPFKIFHIVEMLRSDEVKETDLGWCSADDQWMPLKDIPALEGLIGDRVEEEEPSSLSGANTASTKAIAGSEEARPWMRFLARSLDCHIMFAVFAFTAFQLGFASPGVFTETKDLLTTTGVWLLSTYAWVFLEAWLLSAYGTTPGKLLFNVYVLHEDGSRLTYAQALRRSFTVWIRGYGFGVFPLREMLCIMSFIALVQDGKTPWDEQQSLKVSHGGMSRRRWITLLVVLFSLITLKGLVAYQIDPEFRKNLEQKRQEIESQRSSQRASDSLASSMLSRHQR